MIILAICLTAFIVLISIAFGYFLGSIRNRQIQQTPEEE